MNKMELENTILEHESLQIKHAKEDMINEYKNLKERIKEAPFYRTFYAETNISVHEIQMYFNNWTNFVRECGDEPFKKGQIDINEIIAQWGYLVRKTGKLPTSNDWRINKYSPTTERIRSTFDLNWSDLPYKFLEIYSEKSEWSDVVALINDYHTKSLAETAGIEKTMFNNSISVPPSVQNLLELSVSRERGKEFEKGVNHIFQMLGFEVTEYGGNIDRNPDGIAKKKQEEYAIVINSKSRKKSYKIVTKIREHVGYIKKFYKPLKDDGYRAVYLVVVSNTFDTFSEMGVEQILSETQVKTTLLPAHLLLNLLIRKIENPASFDFKKFQKLLIEGGEITEAKLNKFMQ